MSARFRIVASVLAASIAPAPAAGDSGDLTGIEREAHVPGDDERRALNALLYLPRETLELFFLATGAAGGLIEDEQVVPRIHSLWNPAEGEISVFPTVFAETGSTFNVGGRLIAREKNLASTLRVGYGGTHDVVAESRVRLTLPEPLPFALTLESLTDRRERQFRGVGQDPESDARNQFDPATTERVAHYVELRERFIGSAGARVLSDVEVFVSSSLNWRRVDAPGDAGEASIGDVFQPNTVAGTDDTIQYVYSEVTARLDSRATRGSPSPGVLFESYVGLNAGFSGTDARFARSGVRGAGFLPIGRPSNILSPRIVVDTLGRVEGDVPFVLLTGQPEFRGFDSRRDDVSLVASLDYRWALWRYAAATLFVDTATVASGISSLSFDGLRYAGGFGLDIFSDSAPLGAISLVGSPEGFRFVLRFGVAPQFGDRQHR